MRKKTKTERWDHCWTGVDDRFLTLFGTFSNLHQTSSKKNCHKTFNVIFFFIWLASPSTSTEMNCHNFQRHNKRSFKSVDGYMCWKARWVDLEIEMFYRTIRRPSFFAPRFAQDMQWPGFTLVWGGTESTKWSEERHYYWNTYRMMKALWHSSFLTEMQWRVSKKEYEQKGLCLSVPFFWVFASCWK